MSERRQNVIVIGAAIAICVFIYGTLVILADSAIARSLRAEAVELGYAQHNPKTGQWEWIAPPPTEKPDLTHTERRQ